MPPRVKKNKASTSNAPDPIESAPPEEQLKQVQGMLQGFLTQLQAQNKTAEDVQAFQQKCGKTSAPDMNKKEKKEALGLYQAHLGEMDNVSSAAEQLLNDLKKWRSHAVEEAREQGDLNIIELLKLENGCQPIWDPVGQKDGIGAGGIAIPDDRRPEVGKKVAAFVESTKTWILATVTGSPSNHRYECVDVDDQDKKVAVFARKQIILLPEYTVHYDIHPTMAFPRNAVVLALYPGTTCFYEGLVHSPPTRASGHYQIRFCDNTSPEKYSPPLTVADRFVVAFRKDPKIYVRPSKRAEMAAAAAASASESTSDPVSVPVPEEPQETTDRAKEAKAAKNRKKKDKKREKKLKEAEDSAVAENNDEPAPAPPAPPAECEPSTSDPPAPSKKSRKATDRSQSRSKTAKPKIPKIKRAKCPPHKKIRSTRMFGKRRRKPKVPIEPKATEPVDAAAAAAADPANDPEHEPEHDIPSTSANPSVDKTSPIGYDSDGEPFPVTGLARFGLEDERIDTDSEEERSRRKARDEKKKSSDVKVVEKEKSEEKEESEKKEDMVVDEQESAKVDDTNKAESKEEEEEESSDSSDDSDNDSEEDSSDSEDEKDDKADGADADATVEAKPDEDDKEALKSSESSSESSDSSDSEDSDSEEVRKRIGSPKTMEDTLKTAMEETMADKKKDHVEPMEVDEVKEPEHDSQEGSSSGPRRLSDSGSPSARQRRSSSGSTSSGQSGLSEDYYAPKSGVDAEEQN